MKKTFIKTVFKDLWHNISRFIAIIAIVALGVGFLIGLLSATPDLQNSLDIYCKEQNTQDILIKSSIGFSKTTPLKLKTDFDWIENIEGLYQEDKVVAYDNQELSARVIIKDLNNEINKMVLCKGRYPKSDTECLVLARNQFDESSIGKKVKIEDKDVEIVGVCHSSVYYYKLLEPTTIGTGNLDAIFYFDEKVKANELFTDIAIQVKGANKYQIFTDAYFDYITPYINVVKDKSSSYLRERLETIIKENLPTGLPLEMLQKIIDEEIEKLILEEQPEWYVLDYKSNASYLSFKENSNKVNNVAVVFPFFFFFIAALIALTSITRMVSEDRSSIGTLKSLGYSNRTILMKYLFYALFACVLGVLLGIFSGVYVLPIVIYNCYETLFFMPVGNFMWSVPIILLSSLSMMITIFAVMILVCLKCLRERPNALLVPKAPKAGKRILLDRIGFLWNHLKFKRKSMLRNVFRFKRNLIMMIVGIGGCTALLLVAFGLRDAMTSFSSTQFDEVLHYDYLLDITDKVEVDLLEGSTQYCFYKEDGKAVQNLDYDFHIYYADENILKFMNLKTDTFDENSVIISIQLSQKLHLKKGDVFEVLIDNLKREFTISGVFDNYLENYVVVYRTLTEKKDNTMLIVLGEKDKSRKEEITASLYANDEIKRVTDISQTRSNYDIMSDSIGVVIVVIILCCGALAIIVIYNLTNININERIKEIATLKVLGYHKMEVLGYIYREILFMSILGILCGFILGPLLNYFVMDRISSIGQYFLTTIAWYYYPISFLIALVFVFIVFLLFIPKIKKIKMVESLKCVE